MAKRPPRISRKDVEFDPYICTAVDFLNADVEGGAMTNAERLGVPSASLTPVTTKRNQWRTDPPDPPGLYQLKISELTKGPLATGKSNKLKAEIIALFQPILRIIAASPNITLEDYRIFNIAVPKGFITHKTEPITDTTSIDTKVIGPGELKISLRTNNERVAGIGPNADAYQIALCIVDPSITGETELNGQIKKSPPASYDEMPYRFEIRQGNYIFTYPAKYSGLKCYIYARNWDTAHPDLAGPWSDVTIRTLP